MYYLLLISTVETRFAASFCYPSSVGEKKKLVPQKTDEMTDYFV